MGRAFAYRKDRKMKRWDKMAKDFTRIGKQIAIAVKNGGPDPENNPNLRLAMQNAKGVNMPKDRVEAAIKRACSKDQKDLTEIVYEGYGPHGIAIVVECATDNTTRSVANVRSYFNKLGGSLGKTGSLDFLFNRKGVFKLEKTEDTDVEELELELIDYGADEIAIELDPDEEEEKEVVVVYTEFSDFGSMQSGLEEKGMTAKSASLQRIPVDGTTKTLTEEQIEEVMKLIDRLEEDDDVQQVFHNIA